VLRSLAVPADRPRKPGRPRKYELDEDVLDHRSPKTPQDDYWKRHAQDVLTAAHGGDELEWRKRLRWWSRPGHREPESAWAELGRLDNAYLILAMAYLVERLMPEETKPRGLLRSEKPAGVKEVATAIRRFRLTLEAPRKASRSQQAVGSQ
jgi:hypothetical protein